jgi:uncharacterized protein
MSAPRSSSGSPAASAAGEPFRRYPWRFFGIAFIISWGFWLSGALAGLAFTDPLMLVLFVLGGAGPALAALSLAYRERGRSGLRDIWRRLIDARRVNREWYLLILLAVLLPHLGMVLLDRLLWGSGGNLADAGRFLVAPAIVGTLGYLIVASVLEEIGWRGYALDPLLRRYGALVASLVLGVFWALWHLPLYLIPGTFLHDTVGLGTARYWTINLAIPLIAVLHTWIYNNTARSIYSAVLFHLLWNLAGEAFGPDVRADLIRLVLLALLTAGVLLYWGHRRMVRETAVVGRPVLPTAAGRMACQPEDKRSTPTGARYGPS